MEARRFSLNDLDFTTSLQEAEQAVLSAMLTKGLAAKYIGILMPEDFSRQEYARIYTAIQALVIQKEQPTEVTVAEELTKLYGSDSPMMEELLEARRKYSFTKGFGLEQYAAIVREYSHRRQAYNVMCKAANKLKDLTNDTEAVVDEVRIALNNIESGKSQTDGIMMQDVLIKAYTEIESRVNGESKGIPYGISSLDRNTAGLHRGEMTIIGARPAVGKSALASQIAISAAQSGAKVLICSREMTAEQYGTRILMRGTKVPSAKLRAGDISPEDWGELGDSLQIYGPLNIRFAFAQKHVEDLRRMVSEFKEREGLDVLIVDYTQLMQTKRRFDKDYLRIGYVSKELKDMSVDFNIAVVALAQVGRASEGNMPTLAELRGSGDLEQDADNVIFMHKPDSADDKWIRRDDVDLFNGLAMTGSRYIVLNIAKQRQGETGSVSLVFNPQSMTFQTIVRE